MTTPEYKIGDLISGAGGQADIHHATRLSDRRRFAAKFPKLMYAQSWEAQERLSREEGHYRRLHLPQPHPNVIRMITPVIWNGRRGLILELMQSSFEERLERGIPDQEKIRAIRDAALGLSHLHNHGITHRDMKPSNLLRAYDGRYVVADLGCATVAGAYGHNLTKVSIGTPDLMAPEQHGPYFQADARSDIYGLGTCIAAAFLGQYPQQLPADNGSGLRILLGPNFDNVNPDFRRLLTRCLNPNPNKRYLTLWEFLKAWDDLAAQKLLVTPGKPESPLKDFLGTLAVGALIGLGAIALAKASK